MSDDRTAETAPGTPGQRALGAMESAVRRARASAGAPQPSAPPDPRTRTPAGRVDPAPRPDGPAPARPDRWLIGTIAVVGVLVVAAAIALIVSLAGETGPASSTAASSGPTVPSGKPAAVPSRSPSAHARSGGAQEPTPAAVPTTSTPTAAGVAPAGPPVISSLSPATGSAGQSVVVSGTNFLSQTGQIVATFNGQVAPTSCSAQDSCTVTVPSSSAPSAQVVITTSGGASNPETFTYG